MQDIRRIAEEAARTAGEFIATRVGTTGDIRSKSSQTDLVTATDVEAGVRAARSIMEADPDAGFVIEEAEVFGLIDARPGALTDSEVWVIDPLDGTTSYVHGFPCFSVSVACLRDGVPFAGAVYNVPLAQLASASTGDGATVNGTPVRCTRAATLDTSLLVTGFPYDRGAPLDRQLETLKRFLRAPIHGVRRDGSAAVDLCHVAMGRADGFWEFGLKPWDMAAGVVICREAGAVVTDITGEDWTPDATGVIAANPVLHPLMAEVVRSTRV